MGVEEHLYRMVSEALRNVVEQAQATRVSVDIVLDAGVLRVRIGDDGVGLDPATSRTGQLGMITMAGRASAIGAELAITSSPSTGTVVLLSLPCSPGRPM